LRRRELAAVAEGQKQGAVAGEDDPRTEMLPAIDSRALAKDRFRILEAAVHKARAHERGGRAAALPRRRVRQINQAIFGESR
jgi:hypothetical protein